MTAVLPPIPRFIFTVLEPLSLVAGAAAPVIFPAYFVASQLPLMQPHRLYETEQCLALQLGNLYMLLALIGLFVLNTTTEARVVHGYILALLIADVGHVVASAWVMGTDAAMDVKNWNAMAWGNIGFTTMLFVSRTLYLLGILGRDKSPVLTKQSKKQR